MDAFDRRVFTELFRAVVSKGIGHPLSGPLSEPESRHLSREIEESTGLVIGWRSLKNYATFVLSASSGKSENPSVATLDTLARYVLNAPSTTESERKRTDAHFPYWFRYREQVGGPTQPPPVASRPPARRVWPGLLAGLLLAGVGAGIGLFSYSGTAQLHLQEAFRRTDEAYLSQQGWFVGQKELRFWNRRAEKPGGLTLFTLKGDTWPKRGQPLGVPNLLLRTVQQECFQTEVHFNDFVPSSNWQQAGLLLLEDTLFRGKSIRLSLAYNNYFGGYQQPGEILIQAIASHGNDNGHLEEFVHQPLFPVGNLSTQRIARTNLANTAFRIEKQGRTFRMLYSVSPVDNFSFKQLTTYAFDMNVKYIGVFALKGFVDSTAVMPVTVRYFRFDGQRCDE